MFGFENSMAEITNVACAQPCVFTLKVETHVICFVGQMSAQPAAKLPILRAVCVQLHYVCTQRDQSQK